MTYLQWELMLRIHQESKHARPTKARCNKNMIQSLIRKGFIEEHKDGTVSVTELGYKVAKSAISALYP